MGIYTYWLQTSKTRVMIVTNPRDYQLALCVKDIRNTDKLKVLRAMQVWLYRRRHVFDARWGAPDCSGTLPWTVTRIPTPSRGSPAHVGTAARLHRTCPDFQ